MGNFGKSFSRELGKNTGKVISNAVFGDKWATPKRISATVKIAEINAAKATAQADAIIEKAELEYKVQIDKIKLEQNYEKLKSEEKLINEIVKIHLGSDKEELFQFLNELFAILNGSDSENVVKTAIEKIKSGIFKLEQIGGIEEASFFKQKLQDRNSEIQAQMTEVENKKLKEKREKLFIIGLGVIIMIGSFIFLKGLIFLFGFFASTWVIAAAFRKAIFND